MSMTRIKAESVPPRILFASTVELITAAGGDNQPKRPTFNIEAYNGGALHLSGFLRPVVFDLAGVRADNPLTILKGHNPDMIVGQGEPKILKSRITVSGTITGDYENPQDPAYEIVTHARNGFVWKASVGIDPDAIEWVDSGVKAKANGQTFTGPVAIVRSGRLAETSFVGIGADESAYAKIAAGAALQKSHGKDIAMDFEAFVKSKGLVLADLSAEKVAELRAEYNAQAGDAPPADPVNDPKAQKKAPAKLTAAAQVQADGAPDLQASLQARRTAEAAEDERIAKVRKIAAKHPEISAKAILEGWSVDKTELEVLRASRPQGVAIHVENEIESTPDILQAGLMLATGRVGADILKRTDTKVVEAAAKRFGNRGIGLAELLLLQAERNDGRRYSLRHDGIREILKAAFSNADISGILSNTANKFLLQGFFGVEAAWRSISAVRPVNDFKTITSYRLTGTEKYQQVAPDGEIKHGKLTEESYTNKADTYGLMLSVTRQDIINDDLGALSTIPRKLGRGSGLKLNEIFWAEFLDDAAFFPTDGSCNNYISGATTVLGSAGLKQAIIKFRKQTDPGSNLLGLEPRILLVPPDVEAAALELTRSITVNTGGSSSTDQVPNANIYGGRFLVVVSAYLTNTTAWYLLADPMDLATMETVFLNGQESPTIETADANFEVLGIQMRGYHDFGVNKQEYRAGVKSKGAA